MYFLYYLEEHSFTQKSADWLLMSHPPHPAQVLSPFAMFIGMGMVLPCPKLFEFHGRVWPWWDLDVFRSRCCHGVGNHGARVSLCYNGLSPRIPKSCQNRGEAAMCFCVPACTSPIQPLATASRGQRDWVDEKPK